MKSLQRQSTSQFVVYNSSSLTPRIWNACGSGIYWFALTKLQQWLARYFYESIESIGLRGDSTCIGVGIGEAQVQFIKVDPLLCAKISASAKACIGAPFQATIPRVRGLDN